MTDGSAPSRLGAALADLRDASLATQRHDATHALSLLGGVLVNLHAVLAEAVAVEAELRRRQRNAESRYRVLDAWIATRAPQERAALMARLRAETRAARELEKAAARHQDAPGGPIGGEDDGADAAEG